ncbi:hypothetical protein B5S28_g5109 [[Candida] boidinii]|uniref:Unnamed protein product n=1 Tax=Candida boidinii TaxID=5477 RepID=A0ACB5TPQ2_CANBO|nr:hypothetical protein B5S28_g5109 [[Candida] boidinii]OWB61466.1 hypothetical protein B5S29_g2356 [[Candida] boidinii]OWB70812.1 hypothetical protein B5S31_g492 [[Candida] boidinii]OWB76282.1 hypothetical protein B5S32_g432 [[Candida] boidinii]GME92394.1 unnamed protein product [[Candida] boidinii]
MIADKSIDDQIAITKSTKTRNTQLVQKYQKYLEKSLNLLINNEIPETELDQYSESNWDLADTSNSSSGSGNLAELSNYKSGSLGTTTGIISPGIAAGTGTTTTNLNRSLIQGSFADQGTLKLILVIKQIYLNQVIIKQQRNKLINLNKKINELSKNLNNNLVKSNKKLINLKIIKVNNSNGNKELKNENENENIVQKKTELIDQQIRILENCMKLIEKNQT